MVAASPHDTATYTISSIVYPTRARTIINHHTYLSSVARSIWDIFTKKRPPQKASTTRSSRHPARFPSRRRHRAPPRARARTPHHPHRPRLARRPRARDPNRARALSHPSILALALATASSSGTRARGSTSSTSTRPRAHRSRMRAHVPRRYRHRSHRHRRTAPPPSSSSSSTSPSWRARGVPPRRARARDGPRRWRTLAVLKPPKA